jgi:hypothetical protein
VTPREGLSLPKQNRVTPFGEIVATPERGTCMGNRGILHDADGRIRRTWALKRWLVCVLEFRGRKRTVMTPDRYTELFFLDEATALAAGHRPCAECRHVRFIDFCMAWKAAHPKPDGSGRPTADEMDDRLHTERVNPDRSKRSHPGRLEDLPDGVLVTIPDTGGAGWLVWKDHLFKWSPAGYLERRPRPKSLGVAVLTPPATVAAIRAGYTPDVHASAGALSKSR